MPARARLMAFDPAGRSQRHPFKHMSCPIPVFPRFRRSGAWLALLALGLWPILAQAQKARPKTIRKTEKSLSRYSLPAAPQSPRPSRAALIWPEAAAKLSGSTEQILPTPDVVGNYGFVTTTSGSLTDMSSGTTTLVGPDEDDTSSAVTPIGFEFFFQNARQTEFSVSSNGGLRLGNAAIESSNYYPVGTGGPIIAPFASDQRCHPGDGKVHYKVLNSAPNRVLVVEWLNMQSTYFNTTADLTYQARLYESTGVIEFVYGSMYFDGAASSWSGSASPQIGFSSNNTLNTVGWVVAAQEGAPPPEFRFSSATPEGNPYADGPITVLTSAAEGARRTFKFTPPVPNPPGGPMSFTNVTLSGMRVNWLDSSNERIYAIYQSTDNVNFTFLNTLNAGTTFFNASGLAHSTVYYWRVYAVSEGALSTVLAGSRATNSPLPNASIASGDWSQTSTWSLGVVPTSSHAVTISPSHTVTINTGASAFSLSVAGTLQYEQSTQRTLTVTSDVTIQSGAIFQSNPNGNQTGHTLSLGGSLTNNGTLSFSTNGNTAGAGITFTGTTNATFGGTGAVTDIRTLRVNKGSSRNALLELIPSNFTVRGGLPNGWLNMNNGTIRIGGTFAGTSNVFTTANYEIPTSFGFWLDNPNYVVAAQAGVPPFGGSAANSGLLRISQGTFNHGAAAADYLTTGAHFAVFHIEGGTLNCAGQFTPEGAAIYTQSGGVVNVAIVGNDAAGYGSFELFDPNATFNLTGGRMVIHQPSLNADPIAFSNQGIMQGSSGILQLGSSATAPGSVFQVDGKLPSLVIDSTGSPKQAVPLSSVLFLYGATTIQPGSSLDLNGSTLVVYGPSLTNHGTLNGPAARLVFDSTTAAASYSGSGMITGPLGTLECYNSLGLTIDPAVQPITTLTLEISAGLITGADKVTIGDGGATTAVLQIGAAGGGRPVSGVDVTPVYNPGTGGISLIYEEESSPRTTGAEVPPGRSVDLLAIRNDTVLGGGDLAVTYLLDLTARTFSTGPHTVSLAPGASVIRNAGNSGFVDGSLRKVIPGAGSGLWTFEVGSQNNYAPVEFRVNSGTFPATVTISSTAGTPAFALPFQNPLGRGWKIACDTSLNTDLTFNYQPFELSSNYASYLFLQLQDGSYSTSAPSFPPTDTFASLNGTVLTGFSEWTMVEPTSPTFLNLDATTFVVGVGNHFAFTVIGAPVPTLSLDPASDPLPSGVTFDAGTGTLDGIPDAGTAGSYLLIVNGTNGTFDTQQYFTLYVSDTANQNPVAGPDLMGTRQGVAAAVPVGRLMINDRDPDGDPLEIIAVSGSTAQGGFVTICGCHAVVTYYPPADFSGVDSFTYTLTDNRGGFATGTVTVTVSPSSASSQNITGLTMPGGVPTITGYGIPGRNYRLEYTDDMGGVWSILGSTTAAPNGHLVLTDDSTPLPPSRFYRVVEDI